MCKGPRDGCESCLLSRQTQYEICVLHSGPAKLKRHFVWQFSWKRNKLYAELEVAERCQATWSRYFWRKQGVLCYATHSQRCARACRIVTTGEWNWTVVRKHMVCDQWERRLRDNHITKTDQVQAPACIGIQYIARYALICFPNFRPQPLLEIARIR